MASALGAMVPGSDNRGPGRNPLIVQWAAEIAAAIGHNPAGVMFDEFDHAWAVDSGLTDPIQSLESVLRDVHGLDYSGTGRQYEGAFGIDRGSDRIAYGLTPAKRRPKRRSSTDNLPNGPIGDAVREIVSTDSE